MNDNRNPITNKKKEKKTLYIELIYYGSPQIGKNIYVKSWCCNTCL